MSERPLPRIEPRRAPQFTAELLARARAWMPEWAGLDEQGDFGAALLRIAGRFSGDVAERLDRAGDKMSLGLLDWLAVQGEAARAARMPVVLRLADNAPAPVLASAPVRLQADVDGAAVVFETEHDVRLVPGALDRVVAADPAKDRWFLPPAGLSTLDGDAPPPMQWRTLAFADTGATTLQLEPALGLAAGMQLDILGMQYDVTAVDEALVSIAPGVAPSAGLAPGTTATRIDAFAPFAPDRRNRQQHALYLGHDDLLNVSAEATIHVVNAQSLVDATWQYWGKLGNKEPTGWQPLGKPEVITDGLQMKKPAGAVEPTKVDDVQSRWIRALATQVTTPGAQLLVPELKLRINPATSAGPPACPGTTSAPVVPPPGEPEAEAFANTTPLVLSSLFFPLGREPRQFDTFLVGSAEAFSKPGAQVSLCFEMADPAAHAFSVVREGWYWDRILASVGADRALHLYAIDASGAVLPHANRGFLQPDLDGTKVQLDAAPAWRLPTWSDSTYAFSVAVPAGDRVHVWSEDAAQPGTERWTALPALPVATPPADPLIRGVACVHEAIGKRLYALRAGQLHVCDPAAATPAWATIATEVGTDPLDILALTPVFDVATRRNAELLVVGRVMTATPGKPRVYRVDMTSGASTQVSSTDVDARFPAAAIRAGITPVDYVVAAIDDTTLTLLAPAGVADEDTVASLRDGPLELNAVGTQVFAFASLDGSGASALATWGPLEDATKTVLLRSDVPATAGAANGAPTALERFVVVPGTKGEALVAPWNPAALISGSGTLGAGVIVPVSVPALQPVDVLALQVSPPVSAKVTGAYAQPDATFCLVDDPDWASLSGIDVVAFRNAAQITGGSYLGGNQLQLAAGETGIADGDMLMIADGALATLATAKPYLVTGMNPAGTVVDLLPTATMPTAGSSSYWPPEPTQGRIAPSLTLTAANSAWDEAILATVPITFPGGDPHQQAGRVFNASGVNPRVIALASTWDTVPTLVSGDARFHINAALADWRRELGPTSANPELAWEYWNGTSWWTLRVEDKTGHLEAKGAVTFTVPDNLVPADVAGRTNHWIRARLVGGDYGREQVRVKIKDLGNGTTEQTVERVPGTVRAPSVVRMTLLYVSAGDTRPTWVLAEDNGAFRNQTQANNTDDADVEAFVPLALALQRLERRPVEVAAGSASCDASTPAPSNCNCNPASAGSKTQAAAAATPAATPAASDASQSRALFLGLTVPPTGSPVNLLVLVDAEQPNDDFAPLAIDVLDGDRFQPVPVRDTTRALGESGLVSMAFEVAPRPARLFGDSRTWLRLRPSRGDTHAWAFALRGVYLNAAWASATETLTREPLGSSDGRPMLTLRVARPPLLHRSLELRVREPLGEEEREALCKDDRERVLSTVQDLPGHWVRWEPTIDTADHGADDRVYALDEAIGEVRFGDGRNGRIPPIGRDAVVAFSYRRTEPPVPGHEDVPANAVRARTSLNLVTPVESVEAAFAADQAVGGAPPETAERVLRFGHARLRHRGRAVTPADLEDLALQSSVDVAQARCFVRNGRVRLVVAMRDGTGPSAAQARALRDLLLAPASPALAARGTLRIQGPAIRRLRIALRLAVEGFDDTGDVADAARAALQRWFDPARGGDDGRGWPLGRAPADDDVAYALRAIPALESIEDVRFELLEGEVARPWPATVPDDALVALAPDGVRIAFAPIEVRT